MISLIVKIGPIAAIFIAWFYTYYQGIITAVNIWAVSEIFNHCFFVIPGAFFLIYQKRIPLFQQPFITNYWLLLPLMGTLILYTFGHVGDIRLFMHIATFASLPLLIWFVIGNQAAKVIAFPLFFMLFSIPFGEQLVPYLQELTTDLAVPLLELTGIPVYRNGLYLEIPEGRFLVAEACSGISFLITSIVFGNLYAYISFRTLPKRLFFICISVIIPILANAIRVYGIVLIAHLTDMEYAAGADHLIYGGVFFALVLFLLIMIGESLRDKTEITEPQKSIAKEGNSVKTISVNNKPVMTSVVIILLFISQNFWLSTVVSSKSTLVDDALIVDLMTLPLMVKEEKLKKWRPDFSKASNIQQGVIKRPNSPDSIEFFIATYFGGEGELISSGNKLYSADRWTLIKNTKVSIDEEKDIQLIKIVSPSGQYRYILYWYQFSSEVFTNKVKLKLYQTWRAMLGQRQQSVIIALSIESEQEMAAVIAMLQPQVNIIQDSIKD
ncbi:MULTISPECIES: exosortase A [Colwellia]|uniref:Exosortase A n=1 Tax=Colwellia marinimaniae TaxID=1513592 RepID=A0ABQ0MT15_9GAMM|nr:MULTISPECIES: exosortase A [Colwellia]GAW95519.1 exosortase A [Colwellia marinimaniae]